MYGLTTSGVYVAVSINQTGLLQGRSISKTFVYAVEVIEDCNKRKLPALALKLDFAKAFDTVNWEGLDCILHAHGFNETWHNWMQSTLFF